MNRRLISFLKTTPLNPIRNWWKERVWEKNGRLAPPPHSIKAKVLRAYAEKYKLRVLVETGTYYGDMVIIMKNYFDKVYSIELSQEFFKKAKKRFEKHSNVELIHGDSGAVLGDFMKRVVQPTLFWLDGHYSSGETARGEKDTPIYEELNHILSSQIPGHVIIIDDARCFGSEPSYPTINDLKNYVYSKNNNVQISVQDDSIRIVLKS